MKKIKDFFHNGESYGKYKIEISNNITTLLRKDGESIMYDDDQTIDFYNKNIPNFRGDSLVVGLGYGLLGYNFSENCNSFDYLEIDSQLVDFIKSKFPEFNYIVGDAYSWETEKKYDVIFLDIFSQYTDDYEQGIIKLYNKYKSFLKKGGEISYLPICNIRPI